MFGTGQSRAVFTVATEVGGSLNSGALTPFQFWLNFDEGADFAVQVAKFAVQVGGEIVQPLGADAPEITARFRDPGGNVLGLYQQPG